MKHLIKKILKESVDDRIVDVLIKLKLTNYGEIEEFLKDSGYGENEIKEIYSIYFESISNLEFNPSNWMNFYFSPDQLKVVTYPFKDKTFLFKKDGKIVMSQEKKHKTFWFDYNIWLFLEDVFNMYPEERRNFLSKWVEDNFKLKGYRIDGIDINWLQY